MPKSMQVPVAIPIIYRTFAVPFSKDGNKYCCGRVEIGRQARLRIWCREAYGFDSLRPHSKMTQLSAGSFLSFGMRQKNVQTKGIYDFLTPVS